MTKKLKIFILSSVLILATIFSLSLPHDDLKMSCPPNVQALSSHFVIPTVNVPLTANLEILSGSTTVQSKEIGAQLVPKNPNRPNSALLIQLSSLQIDELAPGTYTFKVLLKRTTDQLILASLQMQANVQQGSTIDFSQASWDYGCAECDPDGDHYNSITEIMNGSFSAPVGTNVANVWNFYQTNPSTDEKPEKVLLLRPAGISVMSPGPGGRLRIAGDPFSVQSGVYVKADLLNGSGSLKKSGGVYSRIDGSFDLNITDGAVSGDRVLIYTISRKDFGDPEFDSSRSQVGPNSKLELNVKDVQACQ